MRRIVVFLALIFSSPVFGQAAPPRILSARALPGETLAEGIARQRRQAPDFLDQSESPLSAYKFKVPFSPNIDFSILPQWTQGAAKLEEFFNYVRDARPYLDTSHPGFLRRAFWLYPVDGCYIRAVHVANLSEKLGFPRPGKVFALGTWATLRARNDYAPDGASWWLFHTAAAYRLGNRAVVLDPAIDPTRVLPFEEWIGMIAPDPTKISVSICDTNAFGPEETCRGAPQGSDLFSQDQLQEHLDLEWKNLSDLGCDPSKLLGDFPPWK